MLNRNPSRKSISNNHHPGCQRAMFRISIIHQRYLRHTDILWISFRPLMYCMVLDDENSRLFWKWRIYLFSWKIPTKIASHFQRLSNHQEVAVNLFSLTDVLQRSGVEVLSLSLRSIQKPRVGKGFLDIVMRKQGVVRAAFFPLYCLGHYMVKADSALRILKEE